MRKSLLTTILAFGLSIAPLYAALPEVLPYGLNDLPGSPVEKVVKVDPRTFELLGRQLDDPYLPTRVQAVVELGTLENKQSSPFIKKALADAEPAVRSAAAEAAGRIADESLLPDVKKLISDSDAKVRRSAVIGAAKLKDESTVAQGLDDKDTSVLAAALANASASHGQTIASRLSSYPPNLVLLAITALGKIGDAKSAPEVVKLAGGTIPVKIAVARALGGMKSKDQSATLDTLLKDSHPSVRRAALESIGQVFEPGEIQSRSIAALTEPDLSVRQSAADLLTKFPTADAVASLVTNLDAEVPALHQAARRALVATGEPAIPAAEKLLASSNPRRREDGSFILGQLKSPASFDVHVALLKDPDWAVVNQVAQSLGRIGKPEAKPALFELVQRAPKAIADVPAESINLASKAFESAIVAETELGDVSILPICKELAPARKNQPANCRAAAIYALGRMGDPKDGSLGSIFGGRLKDDEETVDVMMEAIKAMGHLKLKMATTYIGTDRTNTDFAGDAKSDWLCHWVRYRVSGVEQPLTPLPMEEYPETSVAPMKQ